MFEGPVSRHFEPGGGRPLVVLPFEGHGLELFSACDPEEYSKKFDVNAVIVEGCHSLGFTKVIP